MAWNQRPQPRPASAPLTDVKVFKDDGSYLIDGHDWMIRIMVADGGLFTPLISNIHPRLARRGAPGRTARCQQDNNLPVVGGRMNDI